MTISLDTSAFSALEVLTTTALYKFTYLLTYLLTYLFIYYESRTKVHMKKLKNINTSYEPTTHTSN